MLKENRKGSFFYGLNQELNQILINIDNQTQKRFAYGRIVDIAGYEVSGKVLEDSEIGITFIIEGDEGDIIRYNSEEDISYYASTIGTPGNMIGKRCRIEYIGERDAALESGRGKLTFLTQGVSKQFEALCSQPVSVGGMSGSLIAEDEIGSMLLAPNISMSTGEKQ